MTMPEKLRTGRLSLRLLGPADLDDVHALFSSPGHTIGDGAISDPALTLAWLERRQQRYEEDGLAWYGLWARDETYIGNCGLFLGRCGEEPEIGYEIDLPQRRQGYAAEAAGAVTSAAQAAGSTRVWATIRPANVASVRIVRALGYGFVRCEHDTKGDLDYYLNAPAVGTEPTPGS